MDDFGNFGNFRGWGEKERLIAKMKGGKSKGDCLAFFIIVFAVIILIIIK